MLKPDAKRLDVKAIKQSPGFWYLATPYSKFSGGLQMAYVNACWATAALVRKGIRVFSPISHCHGIATFGGIDPLSHRVWLEQDAAFMDAATGLIVCMVSGWDKSYGIGEEIKEFSAAGKPIYYMELDEC